MARAIPEARDQQSVTEDLGDTPCDWTRDPGGLLVSVGFPQKQKLHIQARARSRRFQPRSFSPPILILGESGAFGRCGPIEASIWSYQPNFLDLESFCNFKGNGCHCIQVLRYMLISFLSMTRLRNYTPGPEKHTSLFFSASLYFLYVLVRRFLQSFSAVIELPGNRNRKKLCKTCKESKSGPFAICFRFCKSESHHKQTRLDFFKGRILHPFQTEKGVLGPHERCRNLGVATTMSHSGIMG